DLQNRLKRMGYSVPSIASSGEEAIKKAKENRPDIVLMDIVLQGDMDGIEAAEKIRSLFDIPVIYLTAYSDESILQRAKIAEPFGYIIKPFRERDLQVNLEIALHKHEIDRKIRDSERWLAAAINSIGDAVIATDSKGIIKIMNPIAEALTGWKMESAMKKSLAEVFKVKSEKTGKQVEDPIKKAFKEGIFYGLAEKTIMITREGMEIPVDIIGSAIKDSRDNNIGAVVVFYDILERRRIENSLKET
ncbi:MAG TPA: response regulator, partial [Candidatus Methanoperedens sp.]